jgi:hypothetical protein
MRIEVVTSRRFVPLEDAVRRHFRPAGYYVAGRVSGYAPIIVAPGSLDGKREPHDADVARMLAKSSACSIANIPREKAHVAEYIHVGVSLLVRLPTGDFLESRPSCSEGMTSCLVPYAGMSCSYVMYLGTSGGHDDGFVFLRDCGKATIRPQLTKADIMWLKRNPSDPIATFLRLTTDVPNVRQEHLTWKISDYLKIVLAHRRTN